MCGRESMYFIIYHCAHLYVYSQFMSVHFVTLGISLFHWMREEGYGLILMWHSMGFLVYTSYALEAMD